MNPSSIYLSIAVVYTLLLSGVLLMPFDFHMPYGFKINGVKWIAGANGVEFSSGGMIRSSSSLNRFHNALVSGTGLTVEVWISTKSNQQGGPARIVSYSSDTGLRNFTLGQERDDLIMRLRTTETDLNGIKPFLTVKDVFHSVDPQHITVTYNFSEESIYVNGRSMITQVLGGSFHNWDYSYNLLLGNEDTGNRTWLGRLFLVAIYNRPLSKEEVWKNYMAGKVLDATKKTPDGRITDGLVALYLFNEGEGNWVLDRSGSPSPLNLKIPAGLWVVNESFRAHPYNTKIDISDMIINIIIFIPLGFLFHAAIRYRYGSSLKIITLIFVSGILFTLGIESMQYFSLTRYASIVDVLSNMTGTALGITIDKSYRYLLRLRKGV